MTLPTSGEISLGDLREEIGETGQVSLNDYLIRDMINKSPGLQNAMSEYYGAAAEISGNWGNISVTGVSGWQQDFRSSVVRGNGTLRFSISGSGYVNVNGSTYTTSAQDLSVSDEGTVAVGWYHSAFSSATITVTDLGTGNAIYAINCFSQG